VSWPSSTEQHGISLHTLYRKAASFSHTFLVIQDGAGYVFGSYNTEAWRMSARYYGTGESFVFQIQVSGCLVNQMMVFDYKQKHMYQKLQKITERDRARL
jgi:hypothetical protein